ncbi:Predicted arabinose efflux permease, MFS family [Sporobacter termitidis DSM 10068]|uniref:Predicted arabinose efflux permease, MFS family n=1 Tax=Sporobacter termitidis DSM 10068 TaxID=1123282 RepID=A0A1M5WH43_9FIRM|nr:MFS transporter [Sporobacter termitidis]SHH86698.1 Predicted arabinose efflux permease, MFS family [Sporobacter termitidis DSM 10068]
MSEVSRNKMNWKIMIPVMLFAIFQSAFMAFSSVLADIVKVFPDASPTLVQMILTVPSAMTIPVSIIVGLLASYITKKNLVLFSLVCELIGGLLPLLAHKSIGALIASSAFIGVGQGFLISIATAILAEHFDGNTRGWAMGLKQAASSVGIAGLTVLTGFLAASVWYNAYFVYLIVIPIAVLVVFLLPRGHKDVKLVGKGVGLRGIRRVFTPSMIYTNILLFFLGTFNFAFYTNIGLSITSKGLGDASAIGLATAWNSLLTIVIGIGFGIILRLFKKFTLASCMIISAIAYFVLAGAPNLSLIVVGGILYGIGAGIQMPGTVYYITESVDPEASTLAIGISMVMVSLGITLSPVIVNAFAGRIDGTSGLTVAAIAYAVMFVIEVIREAAFNKKSRIGLSEQAPAK